MTIDPKKESGVYIDGEWVSITEGIRRLREESRQLERVKAKPQPVSLWDKTLTVIILVLIPFIFADFMQDIWGSSDLETSTKILLTFTVGFTIAVWALSRWIKDGG